MDRNRNIRKILFYSQKKNRRRKQARKNILKTLKDYEYYRNDHGVLYCGDCLEIMPLIEDKVDLVLTDPPYGKQWARGKNGIGQIKHLNEKFYKQKWKKELMKNKRKN